MSDFAIRTEALGKKYQVGASEKYRTLRDTLANAAKLPLRLATGKLARKQPEWLWALQDITVEVKKGDAVGVVGRNGAGKTTLLKVLSRITEPTAGEAFIDGRVGSLLEVGTGFHPELTGRENVYLNGAIIGMRRAEIERRFDEIIEFAELGRFVDTVVKHYSSGMYARLAFAVAAHLEPEILIVDEVLAVGDAAFQKKCLGKMGDVAGQGRTVLFVSHNMAAVSQLCTQGIMLSGGRLALAAPIGEVIARYVEGGAEAQESEVLFDVRTEQSGCITRITLRNPQGVRTTEFWNDEQVTVEVEYQLHEAVNDNHVFVLLDRADGLLVLKSSDDDDPRQAERASQTRGPGRYVRRVRLPASILNEGIYQFRIVLGKRRGQALDSQKSGFFHLEDRSDYTSSCFGKRNGVVLFPLEWTEELADGPR